MEISIRVRMLGKLKPRLASRVERQPCMCHHMLPNLSSKSAFHLSSIHQAKRKQTKTALPAVFIPAPHQLTQIPTNGHANGAQCRQTTALAVLKVPVAQNSCYFAFVSLPRNFCFPFSLFCWFVWPRNKACLRFFYMPRCSVLKPIIAT